MPKNIFGEDIPPISNFYQELASAWQSYETNEISYAELVKCIWIVSAEATDSVKEAVRMFETIGPDNQTNIPESIPYEFRPFYPDIKREYAEMRLDPERVNGIKIPMIKYIRSYVHCGLKEAKNFYEDYIQEAGE